MERCLHSARVELLDHCLVVEDDSIIRLDLEQTLKGLGLTHVHGASTLEAAAAILEAEPIRFAVLDYVVGGSTTVAVAEALAARGVPMLFLTAYGKSIELPAKLAHLQVLSKPFSTDLLAAAIQHELTCLRAAPQGEACEGGCCV